MIRPISLNCKNAPFHGYDKGGVAWGRIASLIEPFVYLKVTWTARSNGHTQSCLHELLTWNVTPSR